jgi:uncharacterized protein (DUF433 family)
MKKDNAPSWRVAILSYNHPELTQKTIESCLAFEPSLPVTLLHNGSEGRWIEKLKKQFPLTLIQLPLLLVILYLILL